jgi:hypothetical protein
LRGRHSEHFAPLQHAGEFMKKPHDKQLLLIFRSTQLDVFDAVAECGPRQAATQNWQCYADSSSHPGPRPDKFPPQSPTRSPRYFRHLAITT